MRRRFSQALCASKLSVFVGWRIVFETLLKPSYLFDNYQTKDRLLSFSARSG